MKPSPGPESILKSHYLKKRKDFRGCSYRWIAKQLSISPTYASYIVNGKRAVPPVLIDSLCALLDIDKATRDQLRLSSLAQQGWDIGMSSVSRDSISTDLRHRSGWEQSPKKHLDLLSDWNLLAILEATKLADYDGSTMFLSRRLHLHPETCKSAVKKLLEAGFLKEVNGKLQKSSSLLEFQSRSSKESLRSYHQQTMKKAEQVLVGCTSEADLEKRIITSATMTCSKNQIPVLRAKVAAFIKELSSEGATNEAEEVYQIGIQFFPLTSD